MPKASRPRKPSPAPSPESTGQSAFLQSVIAHSTDVVTILDADGTIRYVSPSAVRLLGESSVGASLLGFVHPEDTEVVPRTLGRVLAEPESRVQVELRLRHADGTWRVIEASAINLLEDPAVAGILVNSRDITQRRAAEDRLRWLTRAIEQAPAAVIITDQAGNIEYVNPQFTVITGYELDEVLGENPRVLRSGQTPEEQYRQMWSALSSGVAWRGEICNKRKDGTLYWAHASISPIRDATGRVEHFVGVQEDVTERRKLEQQLRQAQKMEAVGQLAGGVAHDFNNLLTAIIVHAELLREGMQANDPRVDDLDVVLSAGKRGEALTRQLLAFSRQQVVQPVVLDPNAIVKSLERLLRRLIGEDILLETPLADEVGNVRVDPGQLEQVLLNLVVNARDAMPAGGRLSIDSAGVDLTEADWRLHDVPRPGRYVVLSVSDTGTGMSPETRLRVFEPFFTTKPVGKGTGLGLATAYGIVKQAGGSITVYSEPGRGSRFRVYLPTVHEGVGQAPAKEHDDAPPRGTETILIVEDESSVRAAAAEVLGRHGYRVLLAQSAEDALVSMAHFTEHLDLIVADVVLPGISGPALVTRLRETRPAIPALLMSGYADATARRGVEESGLPLLQKPFTVAGLARKVREVLDAGA